MARVWSWGLFGSAAGRAQLGPAWRVSGGMRRASVVLLAMLAIQLIWAVGAAEGELQLQDLGRFPTSGVHTDGDRYLLSSRSGREVRVLDAETDAVRVLVAPGQECHATGASVGLLLWTCGSHDPDTLVEGFVTDLGTGVNFPLPTVPRSAYPGAAPDTAQYQGLGERWAAVSGYSYHADSTFYVHLERGTVRSYASATRRQVVDLDQPRLVRRLCAPLRRPLVPDFIDLSPGSLATAGPWAAAVHYQEGDGDLDGRVRLILQGCGRRPLTLADCKRSGCANVVLDERIVAWTEARDRRTTLRVRDLRTGRTAGHAFRTGELALVRRRLFSFRRGRLYEVRRPYAAARAPK